jgi:photosystem II stability/assembly factor-like uncharacterized protein
MLVNKLIVILLFLSVFIFSCKEEVVFYDTLNETNVYSGTYELTKIDFGNNQLGFAVGHNGTVLKTNNGGSSWSVISGFDSKINFNSLSIVEDSIIFISGRSITFNDKAAYKSVDYGSTWNLSTTPSGLETYFLTNNIGYSIGGDVMKTVNGGSSWFTPSPTNEYNVQKIFFLDTLRGLVYTDDYEVKPTLDGGITWGASSGVLSGNNIDFYYVNDFDMDINGVGVIVDDNGSVFTTSNYGLDWSKDFKPKPENMRDVALLTVKLIGNTIITSGPHTIAFSDDMGNTWKTYYNQNVESIYYKDFYFFDKKNGVGIRNNGIFKINKVD